MPHTFEAAATGRSKCRGCKQALQKGELRFGERLANPFGEGEVTHWFHPACAAYKRPDAVLAAIHVAGEADRALLEELANACLAHPRRTRIDGAERAPSSQARCRHCHELIDKGSWRIRLVFYEEGTFSSGGFIHLACGEPYFGIAEVVEQVVHFSTALSNQERAALHAEFKSVIPT